MQDFELVLKVSAEIIEAAYRLSSSLARESEKFHFNAIHEFFSFRFSLSNFSALHCNFCPFIRNTMRDKHFHN
jgi:hypothetical protein